jgi:hypothetical protein
MKAGKNSRPFQFLFEEFPMKVSKKQSGSEMSFWMTKSHLRTCSRIPVRFSTEPMLTEITQLRIINKNDC